MSSEVESVGALGGALLAGAVVLPVAAAFGVGWLAWQGGKLLTETNQAINREIAEKKRIMEEKALQRKQLAYATREHLVDMCNGVLNELDASIESVDVSDFEAIELLKRELMAIINLDIPDDVSRLEGTNLSCLSKVEAIVNKQKLIQSISLSHSNETGMQKYAVADLMADYKIAFMAATINETIGANVSAVDPMVLERAKLNDRFVNVVSKIKVALEHVGELTKEYGLSDTSNKWLHSCFNGIDTKVIALSQPTTTNEELKKGIKRLEGMMEQYEMMISSIDKECAEIQALYKVYVDASNALGEKIEKKKTFKNSKALEVRLQELKERSKRAEQCAEIYKKLGKNAYICYAWDQELSALGYAVHTRKEIMEKANVKPQHAQLGDVKMPYYKWSESEMTQLYSVTDKCDLQVIVHEDGTVSMKTIANESKENAAEATQNSHCSKLKRLHENLKKNWFLIYDYEERETAEKVVSFKEWSSSEDNEWRNLPQVQNGERIIGEREREKEIVRKYQSS